MNLKEAFRYQKFLDSMMFHAGRSIADREHCLVVTKNHKCSKANTDAVDFEEVVEVDKFFSNDSVIMFAEFLIEEKKKLTEAITAAKASVGFDMDAATEVNKYRQQLNSAIKTMLSFKPTNRVEAAYGYKFNVEGNQVQYKYDVDVSSEEAYDRDSAKAIMRKAITESDAESSRIDAAKINTVVEYEPKFDVNESFEDVMTEFIASIS